MAMRGEASLAHSSAVLKGICRLLDRNRSADKVRFMKQDVEADGTGNGWTMTVLGTLVNLGIIHQVGQDVHRPIYSASRASLQWLEERLGSNRLREHDLAKRQEIRLGRRLNAMMIQAAERALAAGRKQEAAVFCRAIVIGLAPRHKRARKLLATKLKRENERIERRVRKLRSNNRG